MIICKFQSKLITKSNDYFIEQHFVNCIVQYYFFSFIEITFLRTFPVFNDIIKMLIHLYNYY